jgi:hypothetical protein
MAKKAVSVTLDETNVLWLRARARMSRSNNVSEALDQLVTEARLGRKAVSKGWPSLVGTIDLKDDPDLLKADEAVKAYWSEWSSSTPAIREDPPAKAMKRRKGKSRG